MPNFKFNIFILVLILCFRVFADETNLFGDDTPSAKQQEPKIYAAFSGVIDFRLVKTGSAENWNDGGAGLTTYGATTNGTLGGSTNPVTGFKVPRITLISDVIVKNEFNAHVQLNYDDHVNSADDHHEIGIVEGYVAPALKGNTQMRLGLVIPPISLENPNAGWSTVYTITPSAINTWAGEELRMLALEVSHEFNLSENSHLSLLVAPYSGDDEATAILSFRGWALHDYQYKQNDRLKFQPDIPVLESANGWGVPSKEIDGRLGAYSKISYEIPDKLQLEAFYLKTNADYTSKDLASLGNDYAWNSSFTNLGLKWQATADLTFISQYLTGSTLMGDTASNKPLIDNTFTSWFALLSYKFKKNRVSYRHDSFNVKDRDTSLDNNTQRGSAETVCYSYSINENDIISAEYVKILSQRDGNSGLPVGDPSDDLMQINYRLYF